MTYTESPHALALPDAGQVVMVTPEVAEQMLGKNTHNRPARKAAVSAYASDMKAGDWRWTGDPIRFSADGTLLDGQHRLMAVIESGVTIPLLVLRGLPVEAQEDIDRGVPRRYSDVLALRGETNATILAALVRQVALWKRGSRTGQAAGALTAAQQNRVLDEHPELRQFTTQAKTLTREWKDIPVSVVGLVWWVLSQIDDEDADFFMHRLADGQMLQSGDPIYELRATLRRLQENVKGERSQRYQLAVVVKAWNAFRRGEKVGVLKFRAGGANPEKFPEPI